MNIPDRDPEAPAQHKPGKRQRRPKEAPLLACPFCGGTNVKPQLLNNMNIAVECDGCGAFGPGAIQEKNARKGWNRRAR